MATTYDLTCEHNSNPLGLDVAQPRFSWKLAAHRDALKQSAYQLQVASAPDFSAILWDSGVVRSDQSIFVDYGGPALRPRQRCYWRVQVWDDAAAAGGWSEVAWFEMGMLAASAWQASWISPDWDEDPALQHPAPILRRDFQAKSGIVRARIYATSLGIYELRLNGARVGDALLTPGWTSYETHLQYQTYDVTGLLRAGDNAIGAMLGDGWFRGYMGFEGGRNGYGDRLALICELHLDYADGSSDVILSDGQWRASTGAIRMSDIYMGETFDARAEQTGWDRPGFDAAAWSGVRFVEWPKEALTAQYAPYVRAIEEIRPTRVFTTPAGETVLDFGQNMVGWVRLRARGPAGATVTIRHAEVLDQQGNFYTENMRKAKTTATYTLKGDGVEVFEPHFTFFGFQFIAVQGYPGQITLDDVTGIVLHSEMKQIGSFECSNPLVNQLQHNILWGQKGNFVDVPTDCPQRDERLGWTGDAQVFIRTACFNMDTAAFFTKWLRDLSADTRANGAVPFVVPDLSVRKPGLMPGAGAAAWSDAATICPWTLYLSYGDKKILTQQYANMRGWVEFLRTRVDEDKIWRKGFQFGDWLDYRGPAALAPSPVTNIELVATAFVAYSARLTSQAASVLGKHDDAEQYAALADEVGAAFCKEFVAPSGRVGPNSQTAYVLALHFDLLPEAQRASAAARLAEVVRGVNYHLTTGFVGTPYLSHVLSRFGHLDVAYELLNQESFPSWLYSVNRGATTIWERWDGIKPDGSFQDASMNSFNHYAYGAIGEWLYRVVAGIDIDPSEPGYKHALIQPQPGGGLTSAAASLDTPYGLLAVDWALSDADFRVTVTVPPNTRATVRIPAQSLSNVTVVGGQPLRAAPDGDHAVFEVASGKYVFISTALNSVSANRNALHVAGRLDKYCALGDLLRNERARKIIVSRIGDELFKSPIFGYIAGAPLAQFSATMPHVMPPVMLDEVNTELMALG